MPGPQRRVCNLSERAGACLLWAFLTCALAYGLLLLAMGALLAVQDR